MNILLPRIRQANLSLLYIYKSMKILNGIRENKRHALSTCSVESSVLVPRVVGASARRVLAQIGRLFRACSALGSLFRNYVFYWLKTVAMGTEM